MEIERKYLIPKLPENLSDYPSRAMEQGYLCTDPVVRIRHEGDDYNLPLTREAYEHLRPKTDGILIAKTRYYLPLGELTIELDVFQAPYEGLFLAEVEFPDLESANAFVPPEWFGEDVTFSSAYHNSTLSKGAR